MKHPGPALTGNTHLAQPAVDGRGCQVAQKNAKKEAPNEASNNWPGDVEVYVEDEGDRDDEVGIEDRRRREDAVSGPGRRRYGGHQSIGNTAS